MKKQNATYAWLPILIDEKMTWLSLLNIASIESWQEKHGEDSLPVVRITMSNAEIFVLEGKQAIETLLNLGFIKKDERILVPK